MSCPWAKIKKPESVNLEDIMSEEVARVLQAKEERKYAEKVDNKIPIAEVNSADDVPPQAVLVNSFEVDANTAHIQFDKLYDDELEHTEEKCDGSSEATVPSDNYCEAPFSYDCDSDLEEEETIDWDRFDLLEKEFASKFALTTQYGYKLQKDGKMVTMSGRKDASKLLSFRPAFCMRNEETVDMNCFYEYCNGFVPQSYSNICCLEHGRRNDKKKEHASTIFTTVDNFTHLLLYKMIDDQLLKRVNGVISFGSEAVILHADSNPLFPKATEPLPNKCVIKAFRMSLSNCEKLYRNIKGDCRFANRIGTRVTRRRVLLWAEKETANLMRIRKVDIPCPRVITLKYHVLIMSIVGESDRPAPKLKDVTLTEDENIVVYKQIVNAMKTMYEKANLIHGDLSESNILWYENQCYIIDVGQAVEPCHKDGFNFLMNDCTNIIKFFTKIKKVPEIATTPHELFMYITGCDYNDKMALAALRKSFQMKPHLVDIKPRQIPAAMERIVSKVGGTLTVLPNA